MSRDLKTSPTQAKARDKWNEKTRKEEKRLENFKTYWIYTH